MIKIEMTANGWILEDDLDPDLPRKLVFEDTGSGSAVNPDKVTMETFMLLLWAINDLVGPTTSRYSKHRIHISLKRGDKYEPERSGD